MKKITSAILGLSLTLAAAGISFAQAPAAPAASTDSTATTTKKHVKKNKKKAAAGTMATPAATPSK